MSGMRWWIYEADSMLWWGRDGWSDFSGAEVFTDDERARSPLPATERKVVWLSERDVFPLQDKRRSWGLFYRQGAPAQGFFEEAPPGADPAHLWTVFVDRAGHLVATPGVDLWRTPIRGFILSQERVSRQHRHTDFIFQADPPGA